MSTLYYGADSGTTSNSCVTEMDFYIGELGGGLTAGDSTLCGSTFYRIFDTTFAQTMVKNGKKVYTYWVLVGPDFANSCSGITSNQAAYDWGLSQGQAAYVAWIQAFDAGYVNTITIFADIEQGSTLGWGSNATYNQQVLEGFQSQTGTSKGVYSSPCQWEVMGSYTLPSGMVVWTSEYNYGSLSGNQCLPQSWVIENVTCSNSSSTKAAQGFGGISPMVWQYGENPDLDVSTSLPS